VQKPIGDLKMMTTIDEIPCRRYPEHGIATTRWLAPKEREMITNVNDGDVYAVKCPFCGEYESLIGPHDKRTTQ
jgi:hypothetical protein